ncbi:MAG: hypothetical protein IPP72_20175 [Chitinophagaceae bacterium]|nr:hypothetical protein [Chitinophagaceae bacterium]
MKVDLQELLPADFNNNSRVWIYQSSRLFLLSEVFEIEKMLEDFVANWKSHADTVKGYANLFYGQFIILMADETATGVSGCSTDSSVRLMKTIEQQFNVQLFDRQSLAFLIKDKVQLLPLSQLHYAAGNNFITADTLYFNNTVLTKGELISNWIVPVQKSWLAKRIGLPAS